MSHAKSSHAPAITLGLAACLGLAIGTHATPAHAAAAPLQNGASQVHITLTGDDGGVCVMDHATAKAGPISFTVTNKTATGITEVELLSHNRILGEKENLAPGLPSVGFTLTLDGGEYQLYCPGAAQEMQSFTVTGAAATRASSNVATLLAEGTTGYAHYVSATTDAMVVGVQRLKAAIDAGNLAQAKARYAHARVFYERIEADVEGFVLPGHDVTDSAGSLDYLIDMRASSLDPKVGWHGFHAIERDLFGRGEITDSTRELAVELEQNVIKLDKLANTLTYKPEDLANGAASLLEEVQTGKITGEEEAFSHYDLVDFAGNIEGAQQAFAFLKPGLTKIDAGLTQHVAAEFAKVKALLDTYRDPNQPGGYRLYSAELKASDGAKLSRAIQALQEPLSRISEKVATAM